MADAAEFLDAVERELRSDGFRSAFGPIPDLTVTRDAPLRLTVMAHKEFYGPGVRWIAAVDQLPAGVGPDKQTRLRVVSPFLPGEYADQSVGGIVQTLFSVLIIAHQNIASARESRAS